MNRILFLAVMFAAAVGVRGAELTFTNLTSMLAFPSTGVRPNTTVTLLGRAYAGDGGGGQFFINRTIATNTLEYADGNGGVYHTATGGGVWDRVEKSPADVRWWGADPTDLVDDTAAMQAALDYLRFATIHDDIRTGGVLKFGGRGSYRQSATLLAYPRIRLKGEGAYPNNWSTDRPIGDNYHTNKFLQYNAGPVEIRLMTGSGVPQILVYSDPTVDFVNDIQPNEVQEDGSIMTTYVQGGGIEDIVLAQDFAQGRYDCHAIKLEGKFFYTIRNVSVVNNSGYRIFARDVNGLVLENLYGASMNNRGAKGIFMIGNGDCHIVGAHHGGQNGPGIWMTGQTAGHGIVNGNYIFNAQRDQYPVTDVDTDNDIITITGEHTYETGMPVEWWNDDLGNAPGGIDPMRPYWAIRLSESQLALATTISNALAGTRINLTSQPTGSTNLIWAGPGNSMYLGWGARVSSIQGNRLEQNEEGSILIAGASTVTILDNNLYDNGFDTQGQTSAAAPTYGVRIRQGSGSGFDGPITMSGNFYRANLPNYNQQYGIWIEPSYAINTNRAVQIIGETFGRLGQTTIRQDGANANVGTLVADDTGFGGLRAGSYSTPNSFHIQTSGRALRTSRPNHGDVWQGPSGNTMLWESRDDDNVFKPILQVSFANPNYTIVYPGGLSADDPVTVGVLGTSSSNPDNPGAPMNIAPGLGFGPTVSQGMVIQSIDPATGTNQQTRFDALSFYGRSGIVDANLTIKTNMKFGLDAKTWAGFESGLYLERSGITNLNQRPEMFSFFDGERILGFKFENSATAEWDTSAGGGAVKLNVIGGGGSGTVTSVGLDLPNIFLESGTPVTTSGTLSATLVSQDTNTVFAAPGGSAAAPEFRLLSGHHLSSALEAGDNVTITTNSGKLRISSTGGGGGGGGGEGTAYAWAQLYLTNEVGILDVWDIDWSQSTMGGHFDEITVTGSNSVDNGLGGRIQFTFDETRSNTNYFVEYEGESYAIGSGIPILWTHTEDVPRSTTGFVMGTYRDGFAAPVVNGVLRIRVTEIDGGGGGGGSTETLGVNGVGVPQHWNFLDSGTVTFEVNDETNIVATAIGGTLPDDDYGDIVVASSGTSMVVTNLYGAVIMTNTVELEAIVDIAAGNLLGRTTDGAGPVVEISPTSSEYIDFGIVDTGLVPELKTNAIALISGREIQVWDILTNRMHTLEVTNFYASVMAVADLNVTNMTVGGTNLWYLINTHDIASLSPVSGANYVVDMNAQRVRTVALSSGNFTLLHATNAPAGARSVELVLTASGGNRTITIPDGYSRNPGLQSGTTVVTNGTRAVLSIQTLGSNTDAIVGYSPF